MSTLHHRKGGGHQPLFSYAHRAWVSSWDRTLGWEDSENQSLDRSLIHSCLVLEVCLFGTVNQRAGMWPMWLGLLRAHRWVPRKTEHSKRTRRILNGFFWPPLPRQAPLLLPHSTGDEGSLELSQTHTGKLNATLRGDKRNFHILRYREAILAYA